MQETRYEIELTESGYDRLYDHFVSITRTMVVDERRLAWYKEQSGKPLENGKGNVFHLGKIKRL